MQKVVPIKELQKKSSKPILPFWTKSHSRRLHLRGYNTIVAKTNYMQSFKMILIKLKNYTDQSLILNLFQIQERLLRLFNKVSICNTQIDFYVLKNLEWFIYKIR